MIEQCARCERILSRCGIIATIEADRVRFEPIQNVYPLGTFSLSAQEGELTISDGDETCTHRWGHA